MLKVGLTGNIASGKSSVARLWADLGATVIDADELARRAVAPGTAGLRRIVEQWGEAALDRDGSLDRGWLRDRVFRHPSERARLEAILHPEVARLRDVELARARARGDRIVVADIPLLFEVGLERDFDLVVLVDAPEDVRHRRLVELRGLEPDEARRMIGSQMPASEKRDRADVVIENDGSLADLDARARAVWARVTELAATEVGRDD